jgi:hypothetical protein
LNGSQAAAKLCAVLGLPETVGNQQGNRDVALAYFNHFTLLHEANEFAEIIFQIADVGCFQS